MRQKASLTYLILETKSMHSLRKYYDILVIENNKLCRKVFAEYKNNEPLEFYKEYVDGTQVCRNLYSLFCGGYAVAWPGEKIYNRYSDEIADLEEYVSCDRINSFASDYVTEEEKEIITILYPEFKYVLKKWKRASKAQVIRIISIWMEHKEVETLLALGLINLVFNKSFWKLGKAKRNELHTWLKANKDYDLTTLRLKDLQLIIKYKIDLAEWNRYKKVQSACYRNISYKLYKYLDTQGSDIYGSNRLYEDYIDLLQQTEHDIEDNYWLYPKDLRAFHEKVLNEVNEIKANKEKAKFTGLKKAIEKYIAYNQDIDGYTILFSSEPSEWIKQADQLHQCIVRCNYMKKVKDRKCLLAFIQKDGKPVATAEILPKKKVGQFYANEWASDIRPNEDVKKIFYKWLERLPSNILKERSKKSV